MYFIYNTYAIFLPDAFAAEPIRLNGLLPSIIEPLKCWSAVLAAVHH